VKIGYFGESQLAYEQEQISCRKEGNTFDATVSEIEYHSQVDKLKKDRVKC
jgi:hypothetical protein